MEARAYDAAIVLELAGIALANEPTDENGLGVERSLGDVLHAYVLDEQDLQAVSWTLSHCVASRKAFAESGDTIYETFFQEWQAYFEAKAAFETAALQLSTVPGTEFPIRAH